MLTANAICHIPTPDKVERRSEVTHVGLQANGLSKWSDIDALHAWMPNLQSLNIGDNPLITGMFSPRMYSCGVMFRSSSFKYKETKQFRQFAVAKIPSLLSLNGTGVSSCSPHFFGTKQTNYEIVNIHLTDFCERACRL